MSQVQTAMKTRRCQTPVSLPNRSDHVLADPESTPLVLLQAGVDLAATETH